jgi:hypothetical protein
MLSARESLILDRVASRSFIFRRRLEMLDLVDDRPALHKAQQEVLDTLLRVQAGQANRQ